MKSSRSTWYVLVSFLLVPACKSPAPDSHPTEQAPTVVRQAASSPRVVNLTATGCTSTAPAISLNMEETPAVDLLSVLSEMSNVKISSDVDLSLVLVSCDLKDVPWDCIVNDLAAQLRLQVQLGPDGASLRRS